MIVSEIFYYKIFGLMFLIGAGAGLLVSVVLGLTQKLNKNIIINNLTQFFCVILLSAIFFLATNFLNFGEFRAFLLTSFLLGFIIQHKMLSKLIAKTIKLGYNLTTNILKKFATSKVGERLFK